MNTPCSSSPVTQTFKIVITSASGQLTITSNVVFSFEVTVMYTNCSDTDCFGNVNTPPTVTIPVS